MPRLILVLSLIAFCFSGFAADIEIHEKCESRKVEVPVFEFGIFPNQKKTCLQMKARRAIDYIGENIAPLQFPKRQDQPGALGNFDFFRICFDDQIPGNLGEFASAMDYLDVLNFSFDYSDKAEVARLITMHLPSGLRNHGLYQRDILFYFKAPRTYCKSYTIDEETLEATEVGQREFWPEYAHKQFLEKMNVYDSLVEALIEKTQALEHYNFIHEAFSENE